MSPLHKLTTNQFIEKALVVHGCKFSYGKVEYTNAFSPVEISCLENKHTFFQTPNAHLSGKGCNQCRVLPPESFIKRVKAVWGEEEIDFSGAVYKNKRTKVKLRCIKHNTTYYQLPQHIYDRYHGCLECQTHNRSTTQEFINKAKSVFINNEFDYSEVEYKTNRDKVVISCTKNHHVFYCTPDNHLAGKGCPKCSGIVSKQETAWLDSLSIPIRQHTVKIQQSGKVYVVDGFDPTMNTVYLFHGDYWHGNPTIYPATSYNKTTKCSFGELYNKTITQEKEIISAGYLLVTMWEADWKRVNP